MLIMILEFLGVVVAILYPVTFLGETIVSLAPIGLGILIITAMVA